MKIEYNVEIPKERIQHRGRQEGVVVAAFTSFIKSDNQSMRIDFDTPKEAKIARTLIANYMARHAELKDMVQCSTSGCTIWVWKRRI